MVQAITSRQKTAPLVPPVLHPGVLSGKALLGFTFNISLSGKKHATNGQPPMGTLQRKSSTSDVQAACH